MYVNLPSHILLRNKYSKSQSQIPPVKKKTHISTNGNFIQGSKTREVITN